MDKRITNLQNIFNNIKSKYTGDIEQKHRKIAKNIIPDLGNFLEEGNLTDQKQKDIINNIGYRCLEVISSGLMSTLTNASNDWFEIVEDIDDAFSNNIIKNNLHKIKDEIQETLASSNFYDSLDLLYKELCTFGQGAMIILDKNNNKDINCLIFRQGTYYVDIDDEGAIDSFCRKINISVKNLIKKFPNNNFNKNVQRSIKEEKYTDKYDLVHMIIPRLLSNSKINKPFIEIYYLDDSLESTILQESFYNEFPIVCPRWRSTFETPYSITSPVMQSMGDILMLQALEKDNLLISKQIANPALKTTSNKQFTTQAGTVNHLHEDQVLEPLIKANFDLSMNVHQITNIEERIKESFYVNIFRIISQNNRSRVTATEVTELKHEQLDMLAPILERLNIDLLKPVILRTFNIILRRNNEKINEIKDAIKGAVWKIKYVSVLHKAQIASRVKKQEQAIMFLQNLSSIEPSILQSVKCHDIAVNYLNNIGLNPENIIKSKDEYEEIINNLQQQQQEQIMQQQALDNANIGKTAKEAGVNLNEVLSGAGEEL